MLKKFSWFQSGTDVDSFCVSSMAMHQVMEAHRKSLVGLSLQLLQGVSSNLGASAAANITICIHKR